MPTTHISIRTKANGVELDRLYAMEEREGGTPALGTGFPALSRTDLSVLAAEEWERVKENFIYESWLRTARADLERAAK